MKVDDQRLLEAVTNLFLNAMAAAPPEGEIGTKSTPATPARDLRLGHRREGGLVALRRARGQGPVH